MKGSTWRCFVLAGLLLCGLAPAAHGYCYKNRSIWKQGNSVLAAIPVYIDLGPEGDLRRLGLKEETLANYVMAVLEEVNRASVTAPRLYFGGFRRPERLLPSTSGSGLHLRAALCSTDDTCPKGVCADDPNATADATGASQSTEGTLRARIRFRTLFDKSQELCPSFNPWNTLGARQIPPGTETCEEPFPGIVNPIKGYCIPFKDFKGVLLHELLHTLGLDHHDETQKECEESDGTHSGDPLPTWGLVRIEPPSSEGSGRTLWRDDIEGLQALYSKLANWPQSWKVIEYSSEDGSAWKAVTAVPLAQETTVPVAVSNGTDPNDRFLVLAYAGTDRFVRVAVRDGDGGAQSWKDLGRVDPNTKYTRADERTENPAGITFHPPAAAYAAPNGNHQGRIAVAWIVEDELAREAWLRWAVRDRNGGAWIVDQQTSFSDRVSTDFRRVSLGYDPVHDLFLLSYLDGGPDSDPRGYAHLWALDPKTAKLVGNGEGLNLPDPENQLGVQEVLHDVGKPVCESFGDKSRCVVPVATSGPNGPCLAWYYGHRDFFGHDFETLGRKVYCVKSHGLVDLALAPGLSKQMVGTMVTSFPGLDPVAEEPPGFDCGEEGLCATDPRTAARVRYRLSFGGSLDEFQEQANPVGFDLDTPESFDFIPGTSKQKPGPPDPGPWWPAAVGSLGGSNRPFRMFVADVRERCGNGIAEGSEECDGSSFAKTCEDIGLGFGSLQCTSRCTIDRSLCGLPGCTEGPGEPGCSCLPVDDSNFCKLSEDGCFPDGPGSFAGSEPDGPGLYCPGDSVCGLLKVGNVLHPVCEKCPSNPAPGTAPYGCPCNQDEDCQETGQAGPTSLQFSGPKVELACWGGSGQGWFNGPGTCLPRIDAGGNPKASGKNEVEEFERTRWLCKTSCGALESRTNVPYACLWEPSASYAAACVDEGGCNGILPGQCEMEMQGRCDATDEDKGCVPECRPEKNSGEGNPDCSTLWGYPAGYSCTTWSNPPRCVPVSCQDSPAQTGIDLSWCQQFLNGE
ncbi:MAG TPA: hypothetical protein VJ725_10000 [Thermoanaerobaculia bacterium]|nr:hypothetical protein [Thermoanaerobaculia bacterium]